MATVKNNEANKDWSFFGVACDQITFATWVNYKIRSQCPWCKKLVAKKYNNIQKHLRTCDHKPETIGEC